LIDYYKNKLTIFMSKINELEKENKLYQNELKKNKYPDGGLIYVIDYSNNKQEIYRIGMTHNMNKRKMIYDTHNINKKEVVMIKESNCPKKLESCIRAILYDYRIKDNKDFYKCNINKIILAIKKCVNSIECVNLNGGSNLIKLYIDNIKSKIIKIYNKLNKNKL
jgi:hypothetical protein